MEYRENPLFGRSAPCSSQTPRLSASAWVMQWNFPFASRTIGAAAVGTQAGLYHRQCVLDNKAVMFVDAVHPIYAPRPQAVGTLPIEVRNRTDERT